MVVVPLEAIHEDSAGGKHRDGGRIPSIQTIRLTYVRYVSL